jgi:hypothetical protein
MFRGQGRQGKTGYSLGDGRGCQRAPLLAHICCCVGRAAERGQKQKLEVDPYREG